MPWRLLWNQLWAHFVTAALVMVEVRRAGVTACWGHGLLLAPVDLVLPLSSGLMNPIGRLGGSGGVMSSRSTSNTFLNWPRVLWLKVSWFMARASVFSSSSASRLARLRLTASLKRFCLRAVERGQVGVHDHPQARTLAMRSGIASGARVCSAVIELPAGGVASHITIGLRFRTGRTVLRLAPTNPEVWK